MRKSELIVTFRARCAKVPASPGDRAHTLAG